MAKVKDVDRTTRDVIKVKTKQSQIDDRGFMWWKADTKLQLCQELTATAGYLKEQQQYRARQASLHARMYGNMPLANFAGANFNNVQKPNNLPVDRPTMNVVQSCVDTLVARIIQARPRPMYLTDNGNYKQRNIGKQMNSFIAGEFYQTKAYELGETVLREGAILGTGCLHVFEENKKVALERVLLTELYVDLNDSFYGAPRNLYRLKLMDRAVLAEIFPDKRTMIEKSEQAYPDNSGDSQKTISDQIMVVEAWHLPSSPSAQDGRHAIVCSAGTLCDEPHTKQSFPFVFFHYSPRLVGLWAQGLTEQLQGTQIEINKLLVTISQSISLVGVPRVFVEDGSKVVKAHLNDKIGAIITYRGTKPDYEVAPCVPQELYAQLQRLIDYAYQQAGISALAASSVKPKGLDSGEAIRNYDDLQSDRFSVINKRYNRMYEELADKMIDLACDIAERDGSYQTIYPNKDGTRQIDLPKIKREEDPFAIQCFDTSSLPKDPSGRLQRVVEMMQAGMLQPQEGRRLLDYPDLEQVDKLETASEERVLKILDDIVDSGKYTPPDPMMDMSLALKLVTQYYNLYIAAELEESKAEKLRTFKSQVLQMQQMATPPQPAMPTGAPQGVPTAPPTAELLPNVPQQ